MTGARTAGGKAAPVSPEAVLRAVVETSDNAIFTIDEEERIASWSPSTARLFGHPESVAMGGHLASLFPGHLRAEVRSATAIAMAGDTVRHFETEILRSDGMPVPVSLSMCPLAGDAGLAGAVVIATDVTEQHVSQAALAEVEARLSEGEALAHVGSWLLDRRTGAVQWSAEFHRIHGVDPLDFDGTLESHLEAVHPDDRERVRTSMEEVLVAGRPFEAEYRVVLPGAQLGRVMVRAQPTFGSDGDTVGLRGIGQDVTERRRAPVEQDHADWRADQS
ncbi:MAG: PAS domain-containing protein [Acidimicrobiales bacterium]